MIKELISEKDPYLREVPEEYTFEKSMEYDPEELKNILQLQDKQIKKSKDWKKL